MRKISSQLTYSPQWDSTRQADLDVICSILSQKFYYLGKGCQCYVFSSEDNQYVIKFFKFQHLTPPTFWQSLPLPPALSHSIEKSSLRRKKKLELLFTGCKLAYEVIPEETGVVFLHLNKTDFLHISTEIYDKLGLSHNVDLDNYEFIIQKKATPLRRALKQLTSQEVLPVIDSLIKVLISRNQKRIIDHDLATIQNIGLIDGDGAIILDVGQLAEAEHPNSEEIVERMKEIRQWIFHQYPEMLGKLEQHIEMHFSQNFEQKRAMVDQIYSQ